MKASKAKARGVETQPDEEERPRHGQRRPKATAARRGTPADAISHYLSADERRAAGKALRDAVPRTSHAGWKLPEGRRDPVDLLVSTNEGRIPALVPIRFGRMMQSPFAFYRGSAAIMAADLATTPRSGLIVQACGDAHLMNFGGFATAERNLIFDINDFDETLPAPWEWDVKRLAASIVIAGQHLRLLDSDCARAATDAAREYRKRMADYAAMRALDVWYDRIDFDKFVAASAEMTGEAEEDVRRLINRRIEQAKEKSSSEFLFPRLVEDAGALPRIKDDPPLIFHPPAEDAPGQETAFAEALSHYRDSLPEHVRTLFDRFHFRDLAIKVVGVGSVGTRCSIGLFMAADDDPLFLQVKEARPSVLEPYAARPAHGNNGERVVVGQRLMQSASDLFLGWTKGIDGRDYYIRQLRDMKLSAILDDWDAPRLRSYGRLCAWALARAHARSGDAARIAGYMGSGGTMDDAICEFAVEYADQNRKDWRAFVTAVREGRIAATREEV
ncbi:DUF2252 domain-containing protein [Elioraea sp.]|uniref:DUF2252 domain-containing protein n=1 Tax=Elioraea sp. TaxID=2185103 RepID=UPI0025BE6E73|nr:DUF2252 domain-containing protein [Elioraea sp.]